MQDKLLKIQVCLETIDAIEVGLDKWCDSFVGEGTQDWINIKENISTEIVDMFRDFLEDRRLVYLDMQRRLKKYTKV